MSNKKMRIHKFVFDDAMKDGNDPNVSLVDKAANLTEVLTLKSESKEVKVTMSMKNYLKAFFGLWEEDAAILAGVLGYDPSVWEDDIDNEGNWMGIDEFIQSKIESVSLLKGFSEIPEKLPESITDVIKSLQGSVKLGDLKKASKTKSEDSPSDNSKIHGDTGESILNQEEIDAMKAELAQYKDLKKSLDEKESIIQDLVKAKEAAEKAAADKLKQETLEVIKGYSFVADEAQEGLVDAVINFEQSDVLLSALEAAKVAIDAVVVDEAGHSVEEQTDVIKAGDADAQLGSAVSKIMKSRYNNS